MQWNLKSSINGQFGRDDTVFTTSLGTWNLELVEKVFVNISLAHQDFLKAESYYPSLDE